MPQGEVAIMKLIKWSYGITTVPERRHTTLPTTLTSLRKAGFDCPRLFVDGPYNPGEYASLGLPTTYRQSPVLTFGNWILSLWELYVRNPECSRFAIFQDDLITYPNLKAYLEKCEYPEKGYLNLLSFMDNEKLLEESRGWIESNQRGRGAVALVFDRKAVSALLQQPHIVNKPRTTGWRKHKKIDGTIVEAFRQAGYKEYIHSPSLIQHMGHESSISNQPHPEALSFLGEDFDALQFLT